MGLKVWIFEDEQLGELEVFANKRGAAELARETAMGAAQALELTLPPLFFDTFMLDPETSLGTLEGMGVKLLLYTKEVRV